MEHTGGRRGGGVGRGTDHTLRDRGEIQFHFEAVYPVHVDVYHVPGGYTGGYVADKGLHRAGTEQAGGGGSDREPELKPDLRGSVKADDLFQSQRHPDPCDDGGGSGPGAGEGHRG